MRLRLIILILAVFAFFSASTGGWLYYYSYRKAVFRQTESHADSKLKLLTDQLASYLSEHIKSVKTLAQMQELRTSLENPTLETLFRANQILDQFTESLDADVCYLMDNKAITICSSNRNHKDSFVGKDFSFRPYFQSAVKGSPATYLAMGTTSLKRGVYYSHPIYNKKKRSVLGVVVIKSSIEYVESTLFAGTHHILIFVDPNGIIFISNKPELRFKSLWQMDQSTMDEIADSKQFGNGPWEWAGFFSGGPGRILSEEQKIFLSKEYPVPNYPGWQLISLRNKQFIEKQVSRPFITVIGPAVILISVFAGGLVIFLYQLASNEISRRKDAETRLRLSEERYRHIYHKTPVMLHSIDIEGRIIRVSDHWVEVMGYAREEVIGRELTDFFTDNSKTYAINVIFPKFFKTGFCKDVPYTLLTRNGEKIDILLSCYGVRNGAGQVVRSLAVSVDVTEKNKTQKALEIAKDKLSSYSTDLEHQVRRRTVQLENAQTSLKKLSKNIIASQEREKELVARELHDHLGQVLTALRIDSVWLEKFLDGLDVNAKDRARKMSRLIDRTIQDVRDMAYRLRPRVLDDLGLADALESLVADFEKRSNVSCVFKRDEMPKIDKTLATALYRIGQEAVTNGIRHANASAILVSLNMDKDMILLTVKDDGCGFDPSVSGQSEGFGLEGMKERANLVGGSLHIRSKPGKGTRIRCSVKVKG